MKVITHTVGGLKAALADIPDETPIAHITKGYFHVIETGVYVVCCPIGLSRSPEETGRDAIPDGTMALQIWDM